MIKKMIATPTITARLTTKEAEVNPKKNLRTWEPELAEKTQDIIQAKVK